MLTVRTLVLLASATAAILWVVPVLTAAAEDDVAKLPDAERQEWQRLWADVGVLLKIAQEK